MKRNRKHLGVCFLLIGLVAGWLAACDGGAVEVAATPECDVSGQTAVLLNVQMLTGAALEDVRVSYRVNGGKWQTLPEPVNGQARLRGGGGAYEIRAEKAAYETETTSLIVPAPIAATCEVTTQTVTLEMARAECPVAPEPLLITFNAPELTDDVRLTATSPTGQAQNLTCQDEQNGCQTFAVSLDEPGYYRLLVDGLPDLGEMVVTDGVVDYRYVPYDLTLRYAQQMQTIQGEGAQRLQISFSVRADEIGCPLPDLRQAATAVSPDHSSGEPYPDLFVFHTGNLLITDLSADECQGRPQRTAVPYEATLPAGTNLADVAMLYWLDGDWRTADCELVDGRYRCTAYFPNPLLRHPYAFKVVAGEQEAVGTSLPFDSMCIVFR